MPKPITLLVAAGCLSLAWSLAGPALAGDAKGLTLTTARAMDSDKDGKISEAEFFTQSEDAELWAELDANGDGVLDAEEQRQAIQVQPVTVN